MNEERLIDLFIIIYPLSVTEIYLCKGRSGLGTFAFPYSLKGYQYQSLGNQALPYPWMKSSKL